MSTFLHAYRVDWRIRLAVALVLFALVLIASTAAGHRYYTTLPFLLTLPSRKEIARRTAVR